MIDTVFHWQGFGDGFGEWESKCRLRIYETAQQAVVIATEFPDNPGTSVTNAAKQIATLVVQQYELNSQSLVWIEHYPPEGDLEGGFDLVEFTWKGRHSHAPRWRRLSKEDVEQLTGQVV